jgi:hypothetical protein
MMNTFLYAWVFIYAHFHQNSFILVQGTYIRICIHTHWNSLVEKHIHTYMQTHTSLATYCIVLIKYWHINRRIHTHVSQNIPSFWWITWDKYSHTFQEHPCFLMKYERSYKQLHAAYIHTSIHTLGKHTHTHIFQEHPFVLMKGETNCITLNSQLPAPRSVWSRAIFTCAMSRCTQVTSRLKTCVYMEWYDIHTHSHKIAGKVSRNNSPKWPAGLKKITNPSHLPAASSNKCLLHRMSRAMVPLRCKKVQVFSTSKYVMHTMTLSVLQQFRVSGVVDPSQRLEFITVCALWQFSSESDFCLVQILYLPSVSVAPTCRRTLTHTYASTYTYTYFYPGRTVGSKAGGDGEHHVSSTPVGKTTGLKTPGKTSAKDRDAEMADKHSEGGNRC